LEQSFTARMQLLTATIAHSNQRPGVQSASLYDNFCKTGNDVIYDVGHSNVGQDSFLSPKTPKNTRFLGIIKPPGVAQPLYSRGHN